jgi:hypothetical protein
MHTDESMEQNSTKETIETNNEERHCRYISSLDKKTNKIEVEDNGRKEGGY